MEGRQCTVILSAAEGPRPADRSFYPCHPTPSPTIKKGAAVTQPLLNFLTKQRHPKTYN